MYQLTDNENVVFHPESQAMIAANTWQWTIYQNWLAEGNTPQPVRPPVTVVMARDALRERITEHRWNVETGGITVGGVPILTGTQDQNRITTVLAAINLGLESVDFKTASGWTKLTAGQIKGLAMALSTHIQACFSAERAHHEAVDAIGSVEALEAYDVASNWPTGEY